MRAIRYWLVAVMLLPFAALAGRSAEIHDAQIAANPKLSATEVGQAVKQALIGRRWQIAKETGSSLEALQTSRGFSARIAVRWDKSQVSLKYLDSVGLDADPAARRIHPTYNKWIANLEKDIPVFMERLAFAK